MLHSDHINELASALAKAQGAFAPLERNREVTVRGTAKSGKDFSYNFRYATLDAVFDSVRKPLADNGLSIVQAVSYSQNGMAVDTMLAHASGQWIKTVTPARVDEDKKGNQAIGSAITYAKRYAICAMLAITADEDDDGNEGDGNHIESRKELEKKRQPSPAGISDIRTKVNAAVSEISAADDWSALEAFLMNGDTKKLAVKVCRDYPTLWRGEEPGSGLAGCLENAGRSMDALPYVDGWITSVQKAAQVKAA
jgi:hypothetical protein